MAKPPLEPRRSGSRVHALTSKLALLTSNNTHTHLLWTYYVLGIVLGILRNVMSLTLMKAQVSKREEAWHPGICCPCPTPRCQQRAVEGGGPSNPKDSPPSSQMGWGRAGRGRRIDKVLSSHFFDTSLLFSSYSNSEHQKTVNTVGDRQLPIRAWAFCNPGNMFTKHTRH